jgi:hypothetical protein
MTTEEIIASLEKGNATVKEIGTDNPTMYKLEKAGVVRKTGEVKKTSKGRGRPAVVWALADASKADKVPAPGQKRDKRDMSAAHAAKRAKKVEREKAALKEKKQELKRLKVEIPTLEPKYDSALAEAIKKNTKSHWNKADQLQNAIIGGNRRIRALEADLA